MKMIYIAGKYRAENEYGIWVNVRTAQLATFKILEEMDGWAPICPHANTHGAGGIRDDEYILECCLEIMSRCDAVLLLPGWEESEGSVAEVHAAAELMIPCFTYEEFFGEEKLELVGGEV